MKNFIFLSILLLAAAPEAFASQCSTQTKIKITPEGRRAIWKAFQANLNKVQKEIDKGDMATARALNETFEFIDNSSRNLDTLSKDTIQLLKDLGVVKAVYPKDEHGRSQIISNPFININQDVCEVIREQRAQEMVALDNPETPSSLVYQSVKNILNTIQQKVSEVDDNDSGDDDEHVKNLRDLTVSLARQEFYKSVRDDSYVMGDYNPLEKGVRTLLNQFALIDSHGKVLPSIREAMLKHEAEQEHARLHEGPASGNDASSSSTSIALSKIKENLKKGTQSIQQIQRDLETLHYTPEQIKTADLAEKTQ